jgi:hypothetical protein
MQHKINDLQQEFIKAGLEINIGKTKEMRINAKTKNPYKLLAILMKMYLGNNVPIDGGAAKDVN